KPSLFCQGGQRLRGSLADSALLLLRSRRRVATSFPDSWMGFEGLQPPGRVQPLPRLFGSREQRVQVRVRPRSRDLRRPGVMGEGRVQGEAGLVLLQLVEA